MISETFQLPVRRVSRAITNTLADLFAEPELDLDNCFLSLIDQSDRRILLGLYKTDDNGEPGGVDPVATWAIEVSCRMNKTA